MVGIQSILLGVLAPLLLFVPLQYAYTMAKGRPVTDRETAGSNLPIAVMLGVLIAFLWRPAVLSWTPSDGLEPDLALLFVLMFAYVGLLLITTGFVVYNRLHKTPNRA